MALKFKLFPMTIIAAVATASTNLAPALADTTVYVDANYRGDLCLNLGRIPDSRAVAVDWGAWHGEAMVGGPMWTANFLSMTANGKNWHGFGQGNVTEISVRGVGSAELWQRSCPGPVVNPFGGDTRYYPYTVYNLNWSQR
jgi:hypothetical protein